MRCKYLQEAVQGVIDCADATGQQATSCTFNRLPPIETPCVRANLRGPSENRILLENCGNENRDSRTRSTSRAAKEVVNGNSYAGLPRFKKPLYKLPGNGVSPGVVDDADGFMDPEPADLHPPALRYISRRRAEVDDVVVPIRFECGHGVFEIRLQTYVIFNHDARLNAIGCKHLAPRRQMRQPTPDLGAAQCGLVEFELGKMRCRPGKGEFSGLRSHVDADAGEINAG